MASAYIGLGITQGARNVGDTLRAEPERQARLAEAKNRQEVSRMQLQQQKTLQPNQTQLQVQQLQNELYTAQKQGLQSKTFDAFRAYDGDGNTKHLNNFLKYAKSNPAGQSIYSDAVRYDEVVRSKEAEDALKKMGITDIDGYFENPSEVGNFVWATDAEGQKTMVDLDKVYAMTGYTQYMQDAELQRMNTRSLILQRMRSGESKQRVTALERIAKIKAQDEGIPVWQAYEDLKKGAASARGTETERLAKELMQNNPDLDYPEAYEQAVQVKRGGGGSKDEREARRISEEEGRDYNEVYEEVKARGERTTAQKSTDEINATKDELDKQFEGGFLDADLSTPEARRKASRYITRIEKDFPMTTEDRRITTELRQLTSLGEVAGENITDQQAGPIDSMIRGVKKYLSNDIGGTAGTAAYESFRNTLRHALYGASLTQGEIDAFNSAAGSLKEQTGPVLVKLKTQLFELKNKLEAVYDLNDEYVAKYRLNMDLDQVAKVIDAIEERADFIGGVAAPKSQQTVIKASGEKKPLAEYFKR